MSAAIVPEHVISLVLLSILIACVASYAALSLAGHVAHTRSRFRWLMAGATAMGIGIWSMHFIAMLAYRLPMSVGYDVSMVVVSLSIAVLASAMGLSVAGHPAPPRSRILLTGPAMGLAIAGMHYTGMAAMRLPARAHYDAWLVTMSIVVAVAASYASILLFLRFRFDRTQRGAWLKVVSAIVMGHAVAGMHYTAMAAVHFEHAPMAATGLVLPHAELAVIIAIATVILLALVVGGAMLDRWAGTLVQVQRSEERFRVMVDAVKDYALFTMDTTGRIDSWNRGAERLLGFRAAEIVGQPLERLYPKDQKDEAERELQLATDQERYQADMRFGEAEAERHVNVSTSAMRDSEGRLIGFVRVLRDITERVRGEEELRRHENQLRQAQKMEAVGQLAGGVAHDFNNMLTAIRGYTDLLRDDLATTPEAEQGFDEIGKAVDRAAALTGQLLAFSRKQMMQPRALNPADTVRDMESMLRRLLVGSVDMVTELDPDVGQITVDPAQLQQVVLNLVINARDAMPNGGRLTIRTENVELTEAMCAEHQGMTRGAHVAMSVTDDGVGMSADILTHIFEPFFTTKKLGMGTGLGLSTAYGIVKQSGGYILVDSRPGLGSKFTVYFPRTWESCPIPAPHRAPVAQPPGTATILLVDDEDSVRRMLTQLLERHGYTVLAAQDGVDALAVSDRYTGRIDLLITDIMMPRMHGRDLSKRLQERRPDTRVLFMSGYASDEIVERGLLDARMAFIQKPFEISELMAKARDTLRRSSVG